MTNSERAADAILALINASPRTPTREAIAKAVAENMPAVTINRVAWNHESKVLEAEIAREQIKEDMREVTGIWGLGGWKAQ
jgi:hypothetical protein